MTKKDIDSEVQKLIELAVDDLHSAEILYTSRKYRNSLLLFQQAVEKGNKAFGVYAGLISVDDFIKIGHKPINIYTKPLKEHHEKVKQLIPISIRFPGGKKLPMLDTKELIEQLDGLKRIDNYFQKLNGKDILKIPLREIDEIIDGIIDIDHDDFDLPSANDPKLVAFVLDFLHWIGEIPTNEAQEYKAMVEKQFQNKETRMEMFAEFKKVVRATGSYLFTLLTFMMCAILVNQHGISTRYKFDNFDPIAVYNKKYPIIRRQEDLMDLLGEALKRLKRYINKNSAS